MRKVYFLAVALLLALATVPSFAAPFAGTGSGVACGGVTDPNYKLLEAPPGVPLTAITTGVQAGWVAPPPGNCWINPTGNENDTFPAGYYDYRITFDWGTGALSASFAADNSAQIWLNGVPTGIHTQNGVEGFKQLTPFTVTTADGLIENGSNYMDFVVNNWDGIPLYSGLLVTPGAVPEPGTLVMLGSGLLGAIGLLRRKLL